mgnify:CR=1 FL=1
MWIPCIDIVGSQDVSFATKSTELFQSFDKAADQLNFDLFQFTPCGPILDEPRKLFFFYDMVMIV